MAISKQSTDEAATLYLVPTPLGNLEDITLRALRILRESDVILCEDTRTSSVLLKHFEIHKPLVAFHAHNEHHTLQKIIEALKAGQRMALISDAGTPGISDPGFLLVRACKHANIPVQCLPGPTAFVPALVQSGIPCDKFIFYGFLPQKKGRQKALQSLKNEQLTVVLYESPHRMVRLLEELVVLFGPEHLISVSRELTKKFEETMTDRVAAVLEHFKMKEPKGEFVIVLSPKV